MRLRRSDCSIHSLMTCDRVVRQLSLVTCSTFLAHVIKLAHLTQITTPIHHMHRIYCRSALPSLPIRQNLNVIMIGTAIATMNQTRGSVGVGNDFHGWVRPST